MDEKQDRDRFTHALEKWGAGYPTAPCADAYWMVLQFFTVSVVVAALNATLNEDRDTLPTADTVRRHASRIERERKEQPKETDRQYAKWAQEKEERLRSCPFEALARKWEAGPEKYDWRERIREIEDLIDREIKTVSRETETDRDK